MKKEEPAPEEVPSRQLPTLADRLLPTGDVSPALAAQFEKGYIPPEEADYEHERYRWWLADGGSVLNAEKAEEEWAIICTDDSDSFTPGSFVREDRYGEAWLRITPLDSPSRSVRLVPVRRVETIYLFKCRKHLEEDLEQFQKDTEDTE